MSKKTITSRRGRFFKLAGMTASVAGRYASERVQSVFSADEKTIDARKKIAYEKMADDIVGTLGELKGAVMKIGQIASQTQDLLPKEFSEALKKLQKEAPPVDFSVIKKQIESELEGTLDTLFKSFEVKPFASASIGQVHRAVTNDDEQVVVKVQYPGVDRSCDSDLKQLRLTLKLGGLLKLPKKSVDALFAEIQERLHEELDYVNEANNIRLFRDFHQNHSDILIPKVYKDLSTRHVLTLEYLEGDHAGDLAEKTYSQDQINQLGENLFQMLAAHLFEFQHIHGDPHPGNFAFRKDGKIIIYDFGCIKILKPEIVKAYKDAISASLAEDYDAVDEALQRLGARVVQKESPGEDYYKVWRNIFFEPFLWQGEYRFKDAKLHVEAAKQTPLLFKYLSHFKPPVESLYIDRMISGHYWLMKSMGVEANFRTILNKYI
jgi:predicted unusual protein kinase regulating ubiquinone biosynthesis (AarF/ABC1/UbiB family)